MTIERASDNPFPSVLFAETVDPANPAAGHQRIFVDTDHLFKMRDSAGTVTTFATSTGLSDPMTTRGDVIVRNASNVTARLGIGSSGKVLSSDGTDVSWQTPSSSGISSCMATRTTTQAINADPTAIALNAADIYDPDGWHDPSSQNTRLTCPTGKGGKVFQIVVVTEFNHASSAPFRLRVKKNGSGAQAQSAVYPNGSFTVTFAAALYLADGDYFEVLYADAGTGGSLIVTDQDTTVSIMG